jgi:O-antigen ligase
MVVVPGLPAFVWDTLTWQTGSSASHANDWGKGLTAFAEHPFGSGLATTDQAAVRFGVDPLTADNGYFKYAVELGIEGLLAFLAVMGGILVTSYRLATRARTHMRRIFGTAMLFATVGVLLNATTAVVFNALTLSYLFFWFAGAAVTVAQKEFASHEARSGAGLELAPA